MRFVIAMMRHETNTFSPLPTPLTSFGRGGPGGGPVSGDRAIAAYRGTNNPIAAFIDIAEAENAEIVLPMAANASPSGPVTSEAFETMATAICEAVAAGCDAALLDLHGAMVTEAHDDGEGELLRRVREVAPDLPVAVALDFHTNLTQTMVDNADGITGDCTYPHVDMYETGKRAGRTLMRALKGEVKPAMLWRSRPMLTHMLRQTPASQPMKDIMDMAMAAEAGRQVLNASVFGGFPLADIPHVGVSAVVVADGAGDSAEHLIDRMMELAWQRREDFIFEIEPMAESIARAKALDDGPVILVDHGDNCGAGGNQDVMDVLAEVMRQGLDDVAAGPIWDPASVARMIEAGVGAEVTLQLGGKTDMPSIGMTGEPLTVTGTVKVLTNGEWTVRGPMYHGLKVFMGPTAVLDTGKVEIVVVSRHHEPWDQGVFTSVGIDPAWKKYVVLKSRIHYRAGFAPIAKHTITCDGHGVTTSDNSLLTFENVRRPIYPLDNINEP